MTGLGINWKLEAWQGKLNMEEVAQEEDGYFSSDLSDCAVMLTSRIRFVKLATLTDLLLSEADLKSKPHLDDALKKSFRRVACPRFVLFQQQMLTYFVQSWKMVQGGKD